jgi:ATP-dependent Clp protease adapter protein ClpS
MEGPPGNGRPFVFGALLEVAAKPATVAGIGGGDPMARRTKYFLMLCVVMAVFAAPFAGILLLLNLPFEMLLVFPAAVILMSLIVRTLVFPGIRLGFKHLKRKDFASAKPYLEDALKLLEARPGLKSLLWSVYGTYYTLEFEAQLRNALAIALMGLEDIEGARREVERAMTLDRGFPGPYYTKGTLALCSGPVSDAIPWWDKARALGLKNKPRFLDVRLDAYCDAVRQVNGFADLDPAVRPPVGLGEKGVFSVYVEKDDVTPPEVRVAILERILGLTGGEAIMITRAAARGKVAACASYETEAEARAVAERIDMLSARLGYPVAWGMAVPEAGPA